ncbi:MAG: hypothetical protein PUJ24_10695, partial [Bacteroidales bacterium]|nr:hypothetical protein [Bacteroidales bacterium]
KKKQKKKDEMQVCTLHLNRMTATTQRKKQSKYKLLRKPSLISDKGNTQKTSVYPIDTLAIIW